MEAVDAIANANEAIGVKAAKTNKANKGKEANEADKVDTADVTKYEADETN